MRKTKTLTLSEFQVIAARHQYIFWFTEQEQWSYPDIFVTLFSVTPNTVAKNNKAKQHTQFDFSSGLKHARHFERLTCSV